MRLINHLPKPIYFVYFGLLSFFASILLFPTIMIEPVMQHWSYWSPDGSKLAIVAETDSRDYEIFVVDSNGRNLKQLTTYSWYIGLYWSSDNQRIYYKSPPPLSDTAYFIDLQSHPYSVSLIGNNAVNPEENPIATQEEIDASIITDNTSDQHYAISTCDKYGDDVDYVLLNNCWHDLDVYSTDTDELVWSIGRYKYRMAKFGILGTLGSIDFLALSLISFFIGLCIALLRRFNWVDKPKRKFH